MLGGLFLFFGVSTTGKTTILKEALRQAGNPDNLIIDGPDISKAERRSTNGLAIIDRAIENSKRGISTILDFGVGTRNLPTVFQNRLQEQNYKCPTACIICYLPMDEITERMK